MNDDQLQEGDLVQLKSGGPSMALEMLTGTRAMCMWFDEQGKLQERAFALHLLQKVPKDGVSGS